MTVIAWIGLGHMGRPMATHLVHAGHTVRGVEPHPVAAQAAREAGIDVLNSVAQAVADADVVFTMLPSGHHVTDVLSGPNGVFAAARPGTLLVDSSTIDVPTTRSLHLAAAARGLRFIDAPVSGGIDGAIAGTLTFMVGEQLEHLAVGSATNTAFGRRDSSNTSPPCASTAAHVVVEVVDPEREVGQAGLGERTVARREAARAR